MPRQPNSFKQLRASVSIRDVRNVRPRRCASWLTTSTKAVQAKAQNDAQPRVQPDRVRRRPAAPPARPVNLVLLAVTVTASPVDTSNETLCRLPLWLRSKRRFLLYSTIILGTPMVAVLLFTLRNVVWSLPAWALLTIIATCFLGGLFGA